MKLPSELLNMEMDKIKFTLECDGKEVPSTARRMGEMQKVMFTPYDVNRLNENQALYFMYRGVGYEENRQLFDSRKIRYDITAIKCDNLGMEYNKTFGHYHPLAEDGLSYPELYQVIYGEALYIMQRQDPDGRYRIKIVKAEQGDRVIMMPGYAHITVNTGNDVLIMANLVSSSFESNYAPLEEKKGGAVYILLGGCVVHNKNYGKVDMSIERLDSQKLDFLDYKKLSIYDEFVSDPDKFEFLNKPSLLKNYEAVKALE